MVCRAHYHFIKKVIKQKNEIECLSYTKMDAKQIKLLSVRANTIKLKEENLHDLGFGHDFLDITPKAHATKEKINWDLIKIKNFCAPEETINKMKRQPTEQKKNYMTDKGLISRIYKKLLQLNNKIKQPE